MGGSDGAFTSQNIAAGGRRYVCAVRSSGACGYLFRRGWCGCLSVFRRVAERIWRHRSSPMVCRSFGISRLSSKIGPARGRG